MNTDNIYCTIVDKGYLHRFLALYFSLKKVYGKSFYLHVLYLDKQSGNALRKLQLDRVLLFSLREITNQEIYERVRNKRFVYQKAFISKSIFLAFLLKEMKYAKAFYVDSDTYFIKRIDWAFLKLNDANVIFAVNKKLFGKGKGDTSYGLYNAGVVGVNNRAVDFLRWWKNKNLQKCRIDKNGILVIAQNYLDIAPQSFRGVFVDNKNRLNYFCDPGMQKDEIYIVHFVSFYEFAYQYKRYIPTIYNQYISDLDKADTLLKGDNIFIEERKKSWVKVGKIEWIKHIRKLPYPFNMVEYLIKILFNRFKPIELITEEERQLLIKYGSKIKTYGVEIGTFFGDSTIALAANMPKEGKIISIDAYLPNSEAGGLRPHLLITKFLIRRKLKKKNIKLIKNFSWNIARRWKGSIDLLLIAGSCSYPVVKKDFQSWSKFVKKGGYIIFRNANRPEKMEGTSSYYLGALGPTRLCKEIDKIKEDYKFIEFVDSIRVYKKVR